MAKPVDQHLIVKSNALNIACYKLTLNEQRLVLLAIAGLNSKRPGIRPGLNQVEGIRITAAEFGEAWKLGPKDAYKALKEATLELYERSITELNGKRVSKSRWVLGVEYHDGEGWAKLSFSPFVVPHLTSIGKEFTEYRLGQISGMRSTYAIRIFEWCVQFSSTGVLVVSLDELVKRLELGYKRFTDIRRKVLEPAITELQTKSNLKISWEPVKEGRAVKAVRFNFKEDEQGRLEL
jgi:plasmid replication initiation protein